MPHLPLNIDVRGMTVLVAGSGAVATRKIMLLLSAGAAIRVVAPEISPEVGNLAASGAIFVRTGCYEPYDLHDTFLVIAATDNPEMNAKIAEDARLHRILVAVASAPEAGNCTFPALLRRGDLEIAVSTNGRCPGFAAEVRDLIANVISDEYGRLLQTLAAEREKLLTDGSPSTYNKQILRSRARELIRELTERKEWLS